METGLLPEGQSGNLHTTLPIRVRATTGERIVDKSIGLPFHLTDHSRKKLSSKARSHIAEGPRVGIILGIDASRGGLRILLLHGLEGQNCSRREPTLSTLPGSVPVAFFADSDVTGHLRKG